MSGNRAHAFIDDALGVHDGVALARLVSDGDRGADELAAAAIARARKVAPELHAVATSAYDKPRSERGGALFGVPTFVKDNTDVRGLPTNHGSEAFTPRPAKADGAYARQYLSTG